MNDRDCMRVQYETNDRVEVSVTTIVTQQEGENLYVSLIFRRLGNGVVKVNDCESWERIRR
jgi:hypothetical protein